MERRVYLDYAATTPVRPEVRRRMMAVLEEAWGNPSSLHHAGRAARAVIDEARAQVAGLLKCRPREVIFTSGGTEADNLALKGVALAHGDRGRHIVTTAVEHPAVLHACAALERQGFDVSYVPVDGDGRVDPERVAAALRPDTILVSVMLVNNEVGTIQPVAEIARAARARGVLVHTDAVQAAGVLPLDVEALGVDLLSLSAHKIGGPKGAGALYVRAGTELLPLLDGGGQERRLRSGTENTAAIAGFGLAAELAGREREERVTRLAGLQRRLEEGLLARIPGARIHGAGAPRAPHITNVGLPGVTADTVLIQLDLEGIAASSGSACSAGTPEPSHVLQAMGLSEADAFSAVRFSLGDGTTEADIDRVLDVLPEVVERARRARSLGLVAGV
ncbi:aminotransferase class V [Thermaerobacter marianensis DSM 12885]|uniref:cysteine desulfurase n=1 Tax=Thermaerobacter marianensis (strain ATCC 700841 / DSM 12885 / JCM 10246 / 7p75a) TaxID=644966 RepID=E6SLB1_THEM7|nr:cysteine desulfurase family protein [Thermaerobacter marianensis]ADU51342.1 aminotransferase class V [Thermaerobacter marianensis DSM 12885]